MRMSLCHSGDVRQWTLEPGDQEVPSARLHVPRIDLPRDTQEKNLHGDVEGSPYSSNPGKIGLEDIEAEEKRKQAKEDERAARVRSQPARASSKD